MTHNIGLKKSKQFAIRIIKLYRYLQNEQNEFVLSKQLLRSGTSIGANLTEAEYAVSKKEFLTKCYIALKECAETSYWLELLFETGYLNQKEFDSIKNDSEELRKILSAITKTTRQKLETFQ